MRLACDICFNFDNNEVSILHIITRLAYFAYFNFDIKARLTYDILFSYVIDVFQS